MTTLEINSREPQAGRLSFSPVRPLAKSLGEKKREKNTTVFFQQTLDAFNLFIPHNNQGKHYYCPVVQTGSQQTNGWSTAFKVNDRNQLFPL